MKEQDVGGGAWQVIGAALLVGVIAGAAWFAAQTPKAASTPAAVAMSQDSEAPAPPPAADIAELMRVAPSTPDKPPPVAAGHTRICGQEVELDALSDERAQATLMQAGAAEALQAFARQQLTDSDHARAVGLVLQMHADANYREDGGGYQRCIDDAKDKDCFARETRAHAERVAGVLDALATLADRSSDPRVMLLAREQCEVLVQGSAQTPRCQMLTARRLVALDRDNAVAWLTLAGEEPGALAEAMYQAAHAPRWDDYSNSARRYVDRVDAKGGLHSLVVLEALMSTSPFIALLPHQLLHDHCSAKRVADANRREECELITNGLLDRSGSLIANAVGVRLATTLGRPDADVRRDEFTLAQFVLQQASEDEDMQAQWAKTCSLGMPRELLLQSATEGDMAAARGLIKASGKSTAQWREWMNESDRANREAALAAQAAASAASSASLTMISR